MTEPRARWSAAGPAWIGAIALGLLIVVFGIWSTRAEISGAVIASGTVVVESNRHVVQHEEGGIVGDVLVRDGAPVAAGQVLLRLDGSFLEAELAVVMSQLVEIAARRARLEAERADVPELVLPARLRAAHSPEMHRQIEGQRALLLARRETRDRELEQIGERIRQAENQIAGIEAQAESLRGQAALIDDELTDQEDLLSRGLVQRASVNQLRRQALQLAGNLGRLHADIAQKRGEIAALKIEKLRLVAAWREEAIVTLRDLSVREVELEKSRVQLEARLMRMEIRAPVDGVVHGATVFNGGAVVQAAEPLMYVVPQDQPLIVAARVLATDVDQVFVGQTVSLRFPAFNNRTTPEIEGITLSVSADAFTEEATGQSYYAVEVAPLTDASAGLDSLVLVPGMPVDTYLRTEIRTPLSYLAKPLTDYFSRALRES